MNKIHKLVRRFGAFRPTKGESELVFKCPECGRWKLSYNQEKQIFHPCFRCSFRVRAGRFIKRAAKAMAASVDFEEDKEIKHPCDMWDENDIFLAEYLLKRGVDPSVTVKYAWGIARSGKIRDRLYMPIIENDKLMCWVARSIDGRQPKELSGPNRSHFFYGYDNDIWPRDVILVEGIFDQIHLDQFGYEHRVLALMGSSISDVQIGKLMALKPRSVILMLDGDEAGRKATETIASRLAKRMNPFAIRKVYLPEGRDPDELSREEFVKLTNEAK